MFAITLGSHLKSQDEWVTITVPVAQTLGWLTREKRIRPGVQMSGSLTTSHKHGDEWCVILPQTTLSFPGNFIIQPPTFLCPCKHKIVQVLTNLVEPWQVGDQRLPLLHEMVPLTPFLKLAAKKVGKRLLKPGLDTGMQIVGDVLSGQSLNKAATAITKVAGKEFLTRTFNDLTQKKGNVRSRGYKRKRKAIPTCGVFVSV